MALGFLGAGIDAEDVADRALAAGGAARAGDDLTIEIPLRYHIQTFNYGSVLRNENAEHTAGLALVVASVYVNGISFFDM